ncbi:PREDICTED: ankyrin repeat-containing protein ITN1-like [Tarenaya hassleriana]|uniref:ankyrin repeat-containing protein ITN1-like n=1 Tax=Tarenaya hassleriana TaxID=28532 RepID=UPI00053C1E2D|nr:PREDICTED: ankyrin repeat-containing protein ITN1-like [Tarenaya hassleriana]
MASSIEDVIVGGGDIERGLTDTNGKTLDQPRDELRGGVTPIKSDVRFQLEQLERTNNSILKISKELKKLRRQGIDNNTNSTTVVGILFATVAFAAIFTVPGGDNGDGSAVVVGRVAFKIFFIFDAMALFTSLASMVLTWTMTLVSGETSVERKVVEVTAKLLWISSICTSVAFLASSYMVVGKKHEWVAELVTIIGSTIMVAVLWIMTVYVVRAKRAISMRKSVKNARRNSSNSSHHSKLSIN